MNPVDIIINGMPGNMATRIAIAAQNDHRFTLLPLSLTGPEIEQDQVEIGEKPFKLIRPENREAVLPVINAVDAPVIAVDFTHPSAVLENSAFYCQQNIPFVLGTTGGDRDVLVKMVEKAHATAVIAPNMAKPIVAFQAMLEHAAASFPMVFEDFSLKVVESHQQGKADTSGTAKAVVGSLNKMGVEFKVDEITKVRDPQLQKEMGIADKYLSGHGWHTYTLTSPDETVKLQFVHNINGRQVYMPGVLDAAEFLYEKVRSGITGKVFGMTDVLQRG